MEQLVKRAKSFGWRIGVYLTIAAVNYVVEDVTSWGLSPEWVTAVSLVGGEATKYLNSKR